MRMTGQRKVIMEQLGKVTSHPTADEVYEMVRKFLPRISLGTVYRNLDVLSNIGVIQKLESFGSRKRFDGNPEKHYHIYCLECGKVDDITLEILTDLEDVIRVETDYEVEGHDLEFMGVCPACKELQIKT